MNYNSGGYSGTLYRTSTDTIKPCSSPGTAGWVCTREWRANYSGTVTKPAVDTRVWKQEYKGTVTKPGSGNYQYGAWDPIGSGPGKWRYVYRYNPPAWVEPTIYEGSPISIQDSVGYYNDSASANAVKGTIASSAGAKYDEDAVYNYYVASSPNPLVTYGQVGSSTTYFNQTAQPMDEKLFPIGKGWSWDIPYVEIKDGQKTVHLAGGGSYLVEGTKLKGYDWEGLSFTTDTSVTVNGEASQYALIPVDGTWKQHFSSDGRLLQISDAYNNTIKFNYALNATYNRKLLSQVTDAIGNTLQITYSPTEVKIAKGEQAVTYTKKLEQGVELLESVSDQEGRKTTYSYQLSEAKFNLMSFDPNRGLSNPYALIWKVQHPTGVMTEYTYETNPVERYIGSSSVNQAYRLFSRKDDVLLSTETTETYNRQTMNYYDKDFGSSYNQDFLFQTSISDGLTETISYYKKDFIDSNVGAQYYLEKSEVKAGGRVKTTANTYEKKVGSRTYPVTVPTKTTESDSVTTDTIITSEQYDDYGNVLQSTDAKGNTTVNTYDSTKRLPETSLVPVDTNSYHHTTYTRNNQGNVTKLVVRKNDASGAILQQSDFAAWDSFGNVGSITIMNGIKDITSTIEYDENGAYPITESTIVTDTDGMQTTVQTKAEYDSATGLVTAWIDGNNHRSSYEYDKLGRAVRIGYPDAASYQIAYDDILNTITTTNEVGSQSKTTWNAIGLKVEEGIVDGEDYKKKGKYGYDGNGRMVWQEDAKGNRTNLQYDNWDREIKSVFPDGSASTTSYDDANRQVIETDAEGYSLISTFDKLGLLSKKEEQATPNSSIQAIESYKYHPVSGQLTELTDARQQKTTFGYDGFERLISVTNAENETTRYEYDGVGNLVKTINPDNKVKEKEYDELGRVIRTKDEAGRKEQLRYDGNDNLVSRLNRNGETISYAYDVRDRVTSRTTDEVTIGYTYDKTGKRLSMTDETGTTSYTYDPYTELLKEIRYADGRSLALQYDANDNRTQMTGPFGTTTYYTHDSLNRLTSVGTSADAPDASYTYYQNGMPKQTSAGNGINSSRTFNGMDLIGLEHKQSEAQLNSYTYNYDLNKNVINRLQNGDSDDFTYDALDRTLTSTEFGESYDYDVRGNRQVMTSEQSLVPPTIMENQYDDLNRLIEVKTDDSTIQYKYNGDGLLVERTQGEETTRYYYDGDQIIAEATIVEGVVEPTAAYIRGNKLEAIQYADAEETKAYPLYNGHGDVVEIRDELGTVLNKYSYDIWGNPLTTEETVHNPFRYSGELWDDEAKLQYLRARWYDPSIGRFINEDTYEGELDEPLTLNLYTYVANNPLIYYDPSGHRFLLYPSGGAGKPSGGGGGSGAPRVSSTKSTTSSNKATKPIG